METGRGLSCYPRQLIFKKYNNKMSDVDDENRSTLIVL